MNARRLTPHSDLQHIVESLNSTEKGQIQFREGNSIHAVSYRDLYEWAHSLAAHLRAKGLKSGDNIAIHADTSVQWCIVDLACVIIGCVSLALYPNTPFSRIEKLLDECDVKAFFGGDEEFITKLGAKGLFTISLKKCSQDFLEMIRSDTTPSGSFYSKPLKEEFTLVSTSGTLSDPRLFAVTAPPLLQTIEYFAEQHGIDSSDRFLLFLPLSHLPQRMIFYGFLKLGLDFVLSDPARFIKDSVACNASVTVTVPRVLEFFNKNTGAHCADILGPAMRLLFVGSAPVNPDLARELIDRGFPIYEVYGTTELGIIALSYPDNRQLGYAGKLLPWVRAKLDDEGALLIHTETPFLYGFVEADKSKPFDYDEQEWIAAGDIAEIDNDFVKVVARVHDFVVLTSGEKIYVNKMEAEIASSINGVIAVLVGNGDKQIRALIFHEPGNPPEEAVKECLRGMNENNHKWESIKAFALIDHMPSTAAGFLTDTMKIRRHRIEKHYKTRVQWLSL